ncbi:MAG: hypothetical protein L6R39_004349 [Caloplaca ligustica]|nr:MAG: hypothetical protein L6R39_004349 [Caloplaca ligustica]
MAKVTASDDKVIQPSTAEEYYTFAKAAVDLGGLDEVKSRLSQWRSDNAVAGSTKDEINYLVPQAARGEGQPEILDYLLSCGGTIGTQSVGLATSPAIFERFLAHGWKVNDSLLHSHVGHPELIALFLSQGANPNSSGPRSFCPLDTAALHGPLETVKLLIDHRANIGPMSAALHAAAQGDAPDRISVMAYLLEQGADINGLATDYPAPSEALGSGRKATPLHTATKWANEEAKAWLLEHGVDAKAKNELGETPEEWGRRFDRDGPERVVRLRRALMRKRKATKAEADSSGK